jgi:hypothetical protein
MFANGICAFHIIFAFVSYIQYTRLEVDGGKIDQYKSKTTTEC